jgi:hypothetical protein
MNNFISTFEELNKLYEEASKTETKKNSENFGRKKEEACIAKSIAEAADNEEFEVIDDEAISGDDTSIEDPNEEEPRQVICECDKCGALVIKDEADIVVDEETDLVNVEDTCQFCEEAGGYKIVGVVAPYEATEAEEGVVEESLTEEAKLRKVYVLNQEEDFENLNDAIDAIKTTESIQTSKPIEPVYTEDDDFLDEGLADWCRNKFDKPASINTQQGWEDELVDLQLELEHETNPAKIAKIEKRIKQLENKFSKQRDWEDRHKDAGSTNEGLLDVNVPVDIKADNNTVTVGGLSN